MRAVKEDFFFPSPNESFFHYYVSINKCCYSGVLSVVQDQGSNSDQAVLYNGMFQPSAALSLGKTGVNRDFLE